VSVVDTPPAQAAPAASPPPAKSNRRSWVISGAMLAVLIVLAVLCSFWLTYQPLTFGGNEGGPSVVFEPGNVPNPGDLHWFVIPFVNGRTVQVPVSVMNQGRFTVELLGGVPSGPDWGGSLIIDGLQPVSFESPAVQHGPLRWPVSLAPGQVLDLNLIVTTGNCRINSAGVGESLSNLQVRYRFAGLTNIADVALDSQIGTVVPSPACSAH
jgi:hypothetical protein